MHKEARETALIITGITLLCKVAGLLKNTALAYFFGADVVVDAYVMVFSISSVLFGWMGGFIGNFTPHYKKICVEEGKERADLFTSNLCAWLILIGGVCTILFELFSTKIVQLAAPGFRGEVLNLTIGFWRVLSISMVFGVIYRLYKEYLNCNGRHIRALVPDLLMSSIILIVIVLSSCIGKGLLIWGYVAAIGVEALIELLMAKKYFCKTTFGLQLSFDNNVREIFVSFLPIFFAEAMTEINIFVDKIFASFLEEGSIAILDYANIIRVSLFEVGALALLTMIYPRIAEMWSRGETQEFCSSIQKSIVLMAIFFIPITLGIIYMGDRLISIIYEHGFFTSKETEMTSVALQMYAIGLLSMVIRLIVNRALLSMHKPKALFIINTINVIVNTVLNAILVRKMGYVGLALATSLSATFTAICLLVLIKIQLKEFNISQLLWSFVRVLFASIIMLASIVMMRNIIFTHIFARFPAGLDLLICTCLGGLVYVVVMKKVNPDEFSYYMNGLGRIKRLGRDKYE